MPTSATAASAVPILVILVRVMSTFRVLEKEGGRGGAGGWRSLLSGEWPAARWLFVLECFEDVEPRSATRRQNRGECPGDHRDRGEDRELRQRDVERDALAREPSGEDGSEEHAEG